MTAPTSPATPQQAIPAVRPVRLLLDADDDRAVHAAAYQWADPVRGRITADPTPHTTSPAYLALDLLRAMGRDGFSRAGAERMSTDPAWRAVTCWALACGLDQAVVLRAHRLTTERLRRLATWREATGIRLTLIAHTPELADEQHLLARLNDVGLTEVQTVRGAAAVLDAIGPPAIGRRHGPPPGDHAHPLPTVPRSGVVAFRADCWRRQNDVDFTHTDGQYRAGYTAARAWLARALTSPPPTEETTDGHPVEPTAFTLPETEAVRLFLARLTVSSPSPQHTVARVRGAQAGFLSRSILLDVPDDLTTCAGPGLTTVPLTPRTVHTITWRLPNPLRAAALAALLFTGTSRGLLSMTQIESVDHHNAALAIDRDSRINIGQEPGPRHMYAVPPRARPLLHAAVEFRRRSPRTADHHGLFANCFGTTPRLESLIADAGLAIPALVHPHPGDDWHTAARCWRLHTPAPPAPDVLPRLQELRP
ncbi:hypothetical protein KV557_33245 [Kitasatospora aureofaciens]|uniref:hypothetical protein n=1 Tax=Kitasatospora aureofaciens TaxID=1894 RepID=UPI001C4422FB|nr:hypothetical protein [Kitasatospora aureofaciens]MBV6701916.1 hypothetical protein [Kitasatospora aureofaciens]